VQSWQGLNSRLSSLRNFRIAEVPLPLVVIVLWLVVAYSVRSAFEGLFVHRHQQV